MQKWDDKDQYTRKWYLIVEVRMLLSDTSVIRDLTACQVAFVVALSSCQKS